MCDVLWSFVLISGKFPTRLILQPLVWKTQMQLNPFSVRWGNKDPERVSDL